MGDLVQSYYSLKIAISIDNHNAESFNNLGVFFNLILIQILIIKVLENKKNNSENARYNFQISIKESQFLFEPIYNSALLAINSNDYQEAYSLVNKALELYPEHIESKELKKTIDDYLSIK